MARRPGKLFPISPFSTDRKDIRDVMKLIFSYSTSFFSIGLIIYIVNYAIDEKIALVITTAATFVVILTSAVLYIARRINEYDAIFIQLLAIAINVLFGILYEALFPYERSPQLIMLHMCVYLAPIFLSALSLYRYVPYIIGLVGLADYAAACFIIDNMYMLVHLPILTLIFIGIPAIVANVADVTGRIERENARFVRQQEVLLEMFDLDPELIQLMDSGSMTKKQTANMLEKMDSRIRDSLVARVREVMSSDEDIMEALRVRYPNLTTAEVEICKLIVEGKTVSEICEIRHVSPSTVTSVRSRLRTKLGLQKGESLQNHLNYVVNSRK